MLEGWRHINRTSRIRVLEEQASRGTITFRPLAAAEEAPSSRAWQQQRHIAHQALAFANEGGTRRQLIQKHVLFIDGQQTIGAENMQCFARQPIDTALTQLRHFALLLDVPGQIGMTCEVPIRREGPFLHHPQNRAVRRCTDETTHRCGLVNVCIL